MAIAMSPDRQTLVMDLQGTLFTLPASGGKATAITSALYDARQPCWYGDGSRIAFQSNYDGHLRIWSVKPDGSDPQILTDGPYEYREPTCSADGKKIAFSSDRSGNYDIWELTLANGSMRQVTKAPSDELRPSFAPNNKDIAYVSERSDAPGIYAADKSGKERQLAAVQLIPGDITITMGTPAWTPDGKNVSYAVVTGGTAKLMLGQQALSSNEDIFPFRGQWLSAQDYLYAADGKIKRRSLTSGKIETIEFSASLKVAKPNYTRKKPDLHSTEAQKVLGILKPVISPDARQIAFASLGQLWLMDVGGKPRAISAKGNQVVTDPSWSLDGRKIAYSSDVSGSMDIWVYDVASNQHQRVTQGAGSEMRPAWSPDGKQIAFVSASQDYYGQTQVVNLENGELRSLHEPSFGVGYPNWSSDGRWIMLSRSENYSETKPYESGTLNQIQILSADGTSAARDYAAVEHKSVGTRASADGPIWSPDSKKIAFQMDHGLWVMDSSPDGKPLGEPKKLAEGLPSYISWTGDSAKLLYMDIDELKLMDVQSGKSQIVPLDLTWTRDVPTEQYVIHAGKLVDGVNATARENVDILINGNRIVAIEPHNPKRKAAKIIDVSSKTVMPGLIDGHIHFAKEYGSAFGKLLLSYGVTSIRNPGSVPADAVEEREAAASGARLSPRVFTTGYILEGRRAFWEMSTPVGSFAEADREIERARRLKYDMVKTYVHVSQPLGQYLVDRAHGLGIPVSSHDIYPAAQFGSDSVEHFDSSASGRGYGSKISALHNLYDDTTQILVRSGMTLTPTMALLSPLSEVAAPADRAEPRWKLQPHWVQTADFENGRPPLALNLRHNLRVGAKALRDAGVPVLAGTDGPLAPVGLTLHKELEQAILGGFTPYEALKMATTTPAKLLGIDEDVGTVEVGKLADLLIVDGNPLDDIRAARHIDKVIMNGRVIDEQHLPLK